VPQRAGVTIYLEAERTDDQFVAGQREGPVIVMGAVNWTVPVK
jgi:hypothetical protein